MERATKTSAQDARTRFLDRFSDLVIGELKKRKMSRLKLATIMGCSPTNISHALGGNRNLTVHTMVDISQVLGMRLCLVPIFKGGKPANRYRTKMNKQVVNHPTDPALAPHHLGLGA